MCVYVCVCVYHGTSMKEQCQSKHLWIPRDEGWGLQLASHKVKRWSSGQISAFGKALASFDVEPPPPHKNTEALCQIPPQERAPTPEADFDQTLSTILHLHCKQKISANKFGVAGAGRDTEGNGALAHRKAKHT